MNFPQNISRRALAKGSAWAAPIVIASTAVPVYAASPVPTLASSTAFSFASASGGSVSPYTCNGKAQIQIQQASATSFLTVSNIPSTTKLSNLAGHYWLPVQSGTTFTRISGTSSCWSVPTATGVTTTYNGVIFREYISTYGCAITVTSTQWTQPASSNFNFVSSCQSGATLTSQSYHYTQNITSTSASGQSTILSKNNGWNYKM